MRAICQADPILCLEVVSVWYLSTAAFGTVTFVRVGLDQPLTLNFGRRKSVEIVSATVVL